MKWNNKFIRFLWVINISLGLIFTSLLSKTIALPPIFTYSTYFIFIIMAMVKPKSLFYSVFPYIILFFTFLSSFMGGFNGLKGAMIFNFITFATVAAAAKSDVFDDFKAFFYYYFYGLGSLIFASIILVVAGVKTQPFTGMYMVQTSHGIPTVIYGLFSDKNLYGLINGVILLVIFLLKDFRWRKPLLYVLFIFVILSGSRSGMVSSVLCMVYFNFLNRDRPLSKRMSSTLFYLFIIGIGYYIWDHSFLNIRGGSLAGRDEFWEAAKPFVRSHFWFGIGRAFLVDGAYLPLHNLYAQLLVEEGFLCMMVYIAFFIYLLFITPIECQVLLLYFMIFTALNPILVPGQLADLAAAIIVGRYIHKLNREDFTTLRRPWFLHKPDAVTSVTPLQVVS